VEEASSRGEDYQVSEATWSVVFSLEGCEQEHCRLEVESLVVTADLVRDDVTSIPIANYCGSHSATAIFISNSIIKNQKTSSLKMQDNLDHLPFQKSRVLMV